MPQEAIISTLGQRIAAVRKRAELSQVQFAKKLGFSHRSLISWEKDQVDPPTPVLLNLRKEFDVSPDWMLLGEDLNPRSRYGPIDWAAYDQIQQDVRVLAKEVRLYVPEDILTRIGRVVFAEGKPLEGAERKKLKEYLRAMALER